METEIIGEMVVLMIIISLIVRGVFNARKKK